MSGSGAVAERIAAGPAPGDGAAVRAERQRFARDLHDSVTQTLIGLQLSAQAALDCWESQPERARAAVETIQRLARGASVEMRALLFDLRDDTLRRDGLAGALDQHAALVRRQSGLQVALRVGAAGAEAGARLPAAHEEALYRLAQEALANVVKHARYPRRRHAGAGRDGAPAGRGRWRRLWRPRAGLQLRAGRHTRARDRCASGVKIED
jgi:signal transduction histidine kinase